MTELHDTILQADFRRMNQLLEIAADSGTTRELHAEAVDIRNRLAADTLSPDWLRGMAAFVVGELSRETTSANRCEGHPAGPFDPMGQTVYCDGSCRP